MYSLPDEIVEIIMHFAGAYTYIPENRPYIEDIKSMGEVIEYGIERALLHVKEIHAIKKAYGDSGPLWISGGRIFWHDTFHLQ